MSVQLFNRATDPFLPAVRPHTFNVLEHLDVVVRIHDGRRVANQLSKPVVLRPQLGLDLAGPHQPARQTAEKRPQRPEGAIQLHQARDFSDGEHRPVQRQTRMPSQLEGLSGSLPSMNGSFGMRRVDQQHRRRDQPAVRQVQDALRRGRTDAVVVGHDQ